VIHDKKASPAVQLRCLLQQARLTGLTFEEAWEPCLRSVSWPHDTQHRHEWKAILGDGKAAWYGDPAPRREERLSTLAAAA
jgi:hypothetical protein